MRETIRRFLARHFTAGPRGDEPAGAGTPDDSQPDVQVAACALLLQIAHADEEFSPVERERIEEALERHFGLEGSARDDLIERAEVERRQAIDDYQFTRLVNQHYDLGQKMVLAEIMWSVILADREIAKHESYLVRKLANLLELEPAYLSQARRRASG